ncbi:MAG TPA: methyltransferase domain-containing protein [Bacteroidota bacterium]|nr:methyltransferase domain-containing protein [Bacteroidota bacterium]
MNERDDEQLKEQVRAYWNAHPCGTQFTHLIPGSREFYEEVERYRYEAQPFMRRVMEFDGFRGKKLLEIGCGLGTDLLQFARGGALVTGVDLTPASIELVKKRFALYELPVRAQVADAEHLPFSDNSFDVVYSFGVLHHTPNTQQALDEVYRVLKPGGRLMIMLYHRRSMHVQLGTIYATLANKFRGSGRVAEEWVRVYDGDGNPLGKSYTRGEVRTMFQKFRDLRVGTVDPYRRSLPKFANALNQILLASWWGFWLVIKGTK